MTKTILTVAYLTKTVSLTLDFTTSFQSPALLFLTHVTQLPCFQAKIHETEVSQSCSIWNQKLQVPSFKPKYTRQRFRTVAWHGSKNYRFPVFKPKSMRWGFLTVVWHGSRFSFSSLQNCRFPFSSLNIRGGGTRSNRHVAGSNKLHVSVFKPKYRRVSDSHVVWKQRLQVSVSSLDI